MSLLPSLTAASVENGVYESYFLDSEQSLVSPVTILNNPEAIPLLPSMKGQILIVTGGALNFLTDGLAGVSAGFYIIVKSGSTNPVIVQENGTAIQGIVFALYSTRTSPTAVNSSTCYVYWNGSNLTLY